MSKITRARPSTFEVHEVRDEDDNVTSRTFTGHAAVFDQPTLIGSTRWGFVEQIARDAFTDVLQDDVRFLVNHDGLPLARTTAGTLELAQDATGLVARTSEEHLRRTSLGSDVVELLSSGDLNQMSFAFTIAEETWSTYSSDDELDGMELRTINKMKRLYDVSVVTYPAYEGTDAGLRMIGVSDEEIRSELEKVRRPVPEELIRSLDFQRIAFSVDSYITQTQENDSHA